MYMFLYIKGNGNVMTYLGLFPQDLKQCMAEVIIIDFQNHSGNSYGNL